MRPAPKAQLGSAIGSLGPAEALALAEPDLALRPLLVATDFDGTISLLVRDPWDARILPSARRSLRRLTSLPGVAVAVLSGRTAADVAARTRVGGVTYVGNHGLEIGWLPRGAPAEHLQLAPGDRPASEADRTRALAEEVRRLVPEAWLVVEHKPPSVTFHYRRSSDPAAAAARLAAAVDRLDPERAYTRVAARRALELRPAGARTKGDSLTMLLDAFRPAVALVLGDDRTDADAFAALRLARDAGRVRGLALAVRSGEELPDVVAAADLSLGSPAAAAAFLQALARRLSDAAIPAGPA